MRRFAESQTSYEYGGVAIEYLIVSVFALLLTVAGMALVTKTIKSKLQHLSETWGEDLELDELDIFEQGD